MKTENIFTGKRLLKIREGMEYTGFGRNKFLKWAKEIGAVRRYGGAVRYDIAVIDRAIDAPVEEGRVED